MRRPEDWRARSGRGNGGAARAFCAVLLIAGIATAAPAFASKEADLQALREKIEKVQRDVSAAESSRSEAADALKASEKAISEVNRTLHDLGRERQALNADLQGINARIQAATADIARQRELIDRLVRHQYMHGSNDGLRLILEGADVAAVERELHYYGYISKLRSEMIRGLQKSVAGLADLKAAALHSSEELAANEAGQRRAKTEIEREKLARRKLLVRISGEITKGRREIGRLRRDEDRLTQLIEQIAKALAAKPADKRIRKPGDIVDEVADGSFAGKAFASLKGKLKLPARGELAGRFGSPREEGSTWKGLFIRSAGGQPVRSVADGRVVYVDWLRGFGNLIIVDHGQGYYSLYGNNESVVKQVGDTVKSGDTVASVGDTGGAGESGLYFELRHEGKPFDPMKWVGR